MTNENEPLTQEQIQAIEASIESRSSCLEDAFMNVIIQSVPVSQCADALKTSIDEILSTIDAGQFEIAANLGYGDLTSNFVWMQRTLGAMQDAAMRCSNEVSAVAGDCGLAYEQVEPLVVEFFEKVRGPRGRQLIDEERKTKLDKMLANFRHTQPPQ